MKTEIATRFAKAFQKWFIISGILFFPATVMGQTGNANEIYVDQISAGGAGSNLTLTVAQIGTTNIIGGSNLSSTQSASGVQFAILSGNDQTVIVEQGGVSNTTLLDLLGNTIDVKLFSGGDSNKLVLECADNGVTCESASIDWNVTGSSNVVDYLIGSNSATDSLAFTATLNGSGNTFIDLADYESNDVNSAVKILDQRTINTEINAASLDGISLERVTSCAVDAVNCVVGELTLATTGTTPTDGTLIDLEDPTSFRVAAGSDFAQTNSIDGSNQTLEILVFGDNNVFTTEIAGQNHTLNLTLDGSDSFVSVRMDGDNSIVDLRLEGGSANVAVLSSDTLDGSR